MLEALSTPATCKVPRTPSTAGSSAARKVGPTLVPKLLLYAELPSPGHPPRTPPTQLRLSDLLQHSASTTGSGGYAGSSQSPESSTRPLRLSELLPPPPMAPPAARNGTPSTDSGAALEEAPDAHTSVPVAVGRAPRLQQQSQPEQLPPKPQQPPPSLLQAIFGSPGSRNGGPGRRIVTEGRNSSQDNDDDFKPKRLSFGGR